MEVPKARIRGEVQRAGLQPRLLAWAWDASRERGYRQGFLRPKPRGGAPREPRKWRYCTNAPSRAKTWLFWGVKRGNCTISQGPSVVMADTSEARFCKSPGHRIVRILQSWQNSGLLYCPEAHRRTVSRFHASKGRKNCPGRQRTRRPPTPGKPSHSGTAVRRRFSPTFEIARRGPTT